MKKFVWSALIILLSCKLEAQTSLVQGTVMDENGRALSGVSVELLPTGQGVFTDEVGRFQLQVPKEANRLRFALLGFTPQEYAIPSDGQPLMITLYRKTHTLQEVVVVGFGERSRKELTTAVNKLDAGNFRHMPITQWEQALQGQLPGVVLTPASGSPDAAVSIRVRGAGSISAGNQPLIVVDGIVLSGQGGTETLGYPTNPFLNLNPDDIASIEVLKDAAATAIYGAQGGNGVILITTKSGAYEAAPQVQLDYSAGFSEASRRYDLLTGQEYASLWNEAAANGGITGFTYTVENEPSTDWAS
ncbi:MAG: TonB-dependent receptor plug domain-containing protein, partial [Bacteroidota bacterium]